jgi:transketolase
MEFPLSLAEPPLCITTVRTLAIDGVERANSGHPGAPMGLAPVGWQLFSGFLRHSPSNPTWPGRDRFVLSNGHASMLLYALLHLTGYDLTLDDLKSFRTLGSRTPGHPERGVAPGVEVATGPLGQGLANAVGMALTERMLAGTFNRPGHEIVDHRTWFICSDGDLMEGISHEAASLAGFLKLGKLVGVYDDNLISLDGPTSLSFGEDITGRFEAYGWRVLHIADGNDPAAITRAFNEASVGDGRPTLIRCRTNIGFGSPNKHDSSSSHGSPLGTEEVVLTKRAYGWPESPDFLVPDEVAAWAGELIKRGKHSEREWDGRMAAYRVAFPSEATELERRLAGELPSGWADDLPVYGADAKPIATRSASKEALNAIAGRLPELVGGAADLASSTNTVITDGGDISPGSFEGRNIHFGVREHAMAAVINGMSAHGGVRVFGSTFLTFSDYMKNPIRMASLMHLPAIFVFTHDSVALGEDGPTHQPIEHLAGLRAIPGVAVIRPADANETAQAWKVAIERTDGPTVLIFTRQALPIITGAVDVARGAYVLDEGDDCILIASGSEVAVAREARGLLAADGVSARVVSMPSAEIFSAQPADYRDQVIPTAVRARVTVEAAATLGWHRFAGDLGEVIGIDRFGESAPGELVLEALGITAEAVANAAKRSMDRVGR